MFKESFFPFLPNETVTPSPINPTRSDAIKIISPGGKSSQDKPDLLDKVEMIFTDVETEGKKRGYSKAAAEYEKAFQSIEKEYADAQSFIERQKGIYDEKSEELINKLEKLEAEKEKLETAVKQKSIDSRSEELTNKVDSLKRRKEALEEVVNQKSLAVADKYNIPVQEVRQACLSQTLFSCDYQLDLLSIIYDIKKKKLLKAEQQGYLEAKEMYNKKIQDLKGKLDRLKEKGNAKLNELIQLIADVLDDIEKEEMRIADLKILL